MIWVYDTETYPNLHLAVFIHRDTDEMRRFITWVDGSESINELAEYQKFLKEEVKGLIGYNNAKYDYILVDYILKVNPSKDIVEVLTELDSLSSRAISDDVYIPEWKHRIPQLDLMKIWHFDNKARMTSLKSLEVAMRWPNVRDLPYDPGTWITREMAMETAEYCVNDTAATKAFFQESREMIYNRKLFEKTFGFKCTNYSDVKIGEKINALTYEKKTGIPYRAFKDLRTHRSVINVRDCIADFVEFQTDQFKAFLNKIMHLTFAPTDEFRFHISYGGKVYTIAKGGLHSDDKPEVIYAGEYYLQEDDVASMYPACLINNRFYPKHLDVAWLEGMKENYEYRKDELKPTISKLKKEGRKNSIEYIHAKSMADGLKLGLNGGGFGKTNSIFSWQFDPLVTFQTTITGQLSLLMLIEAYDVAGIEVISANTDGVVSRVREDQLEIYHKIRDWWQKKTGFILERTLYDKIIFSNVNNYIAHIKMEGYEDLKFKGWFEINKEWHKNHSNRIVSIAVANYFINGVPVEETIKNHLDKTHYEIGPKTFKAYGIYDFCITQKVGKEMKVYWGDEKVQRINRYYVSRSGQRLTKHKDDKVTSMLYKPVQIFNVFEEKEEYDIDYSYYVTQAMEIIYPIENVQTLFKL